MFEENRYKRKDLCSGYIDNSLSNKAIDLFYEISNPDEVNLVVLFNACAHLRSKEALDVAKGVSKEMSTCFYSNVRVCSSLLDALIKCGDTSSAHLLFSQMRKCSVNYGMLMSGLNEENNFDKTLDLYREMKKDGVEADSLNYLHVIKALARIGDYSLSDSVVKQIPSSVLLDYQIQTALIDMWVRSKNDLASSSSFKNISVG